MSSNHYFPYLTPPLDNTHSCYPQSQTQTPHPPCPSSRTFPLTLQKPSALSVKGDPHPFKSYSSFKSKLKFLLFKKTFTTPKLISLCFDLWYCLLVVCVGFSGALSRTVFSAGLIGIIPKVCGLCDLKGPRHHLF